MPKSKRPLVGIQLPVDSTGKRKSTSFNKNTWIAAAKALDSDEGRKFIDRVNKEKNWRHKYIPFVRDHMKLCADSENCLKMAKAGWDFVYSNMEVIREAGAKPQSLAEAMSTPNVNDAFETGIIKGTGKPVRELCIPYQRKELKGEGARSVIKYWKDTGVIESDTSDALNGFISDEKVYSVLSNKVFVLLGAISEMGPLQRLLSWGATVVGVDISFQSVQERLFSFAKGVPGTLIVPMKKGTSSTPQEKWTENSGADLLTKFPEVAEWLVNLEPEKEMVIGSYCYLDGERFIKIVTTMDAICTTVAAKRKTKTAFSWLATPTDCHLVTADAVRAANKQKQGLAVKMMSCLTKPGYKSDDKVNEEQFVNCVVNQQGPNYILAKRLQTWRAMLHRSGGSPVSLNVAPTTKTVSVMKNKIFAFTMDGMENFVPMEPFETQTTKSVMAALLLWDLYKKTSSEKLKNPLQLLQRNQVHGGMYRTGIQFESMGTPAFLLAAFGAYWWVLAIALALGYACVGM